MSNIEWKCETCVYAKECGGTGVDSEGNKIDVDSIRCNHPDPDISSINNDALSEGKTITECCEYKEKPPASPNPKQEAALLDKAEEMRQSESIRDPDLVRDPGCLDLGE